jgi:hypothetical protein
MRLAICLLWVSALLLLSSHAKAAVQGQVELEITGDSRSGAGMSFQQWGQALSAAGVQNVRLRSGQDGDKPGIEVGGTAQMPFYKVTAVLGSGDVLIVPGARFRRSECKKLATWLDDLAKLGPPEKREKVAAFGLLATQFQKVNTDLSKPVGFSTQGMTRSEAVNKIAGQLGLTLTIDGTLTEGDDKIEEELTNVSSGSALACILRPIGFCMVPRASGETLSYTVKKAELDHEVWPIGWPADDRKVLPGIQAFHKVNVANKRVTDVLAAIGKNLNVPVLYDHNAMARHGIDLDKTLVTYSNQRTTYKFALDRMLGKVELKLEVRIDEAGKPFLWISTLKPV